MRQLLPRDTHVLDPDEVARLSVQNFEVYHRLTKGSAHNYELVCIALKYTSRISDLRKVLRPKGWNITKQRITRGIYAYTLERIPPKPVVCVDTSAEACAG